MTFIDVTLVPVSTDRKTAYVAFSRRMAEVYRDHGALRIVDYWQSEQPTASEDFHAADASYDDGELRSIGDVLGAKASESVVVTVTEWPSRESRDSGVAAATSDPRVTATLDEPAVFDGERLVAQGFEIAMTLESSSRDTQSNR